MAPRMTQHHELPPTANDSLFRFALDLLPTGLLIINAQQKIVLANRALNAIFGYENDELVGQNLNCLLARDKHAEHLSLAKKLFNFQHDSYEMAGGRSVKGIKKNGEEATVLIRLSVHDFAGTPHAFAQINDVNDVSSNRDFILESNNRLRRATDATRDGIWEWNLKSNRVWYNPQFMKMLGRSPDEAPKIEQWQEHIHPDDQSQFNNVLRSHLEQGSEFDLIYRGLSSSGKYEWFHARGNSLYDVMGKPVLMSGTLSNINEKIYLENSLKQQSRFLNQVLERSLAGLYIFNLKSLCNTYINPEYSRITGYNLAQLQTAQQDSSLMPLFHPEDTERIYRHLEDVIERSKQKKRPKNFEYRFRHKRGHWIWCLSRDSIYSFDEHGEPHEMIGTFLDITQLKKRELENKKLSRDYTITFEQVAVGLAHINASGVIIKANKKLSDILLYSHGDMVGRHYTDFIYHDDLPFSMEVFKSLQENQIDNASFEKRCVRSDGEIIWTLCTSNIVQPDEANEAPYYIAVIEDISERKLMEQRLKESNSALERFACSASHDLQEPIRKINVFSELLHERLASQIHDEESLYQLDRIADASRRSSDMIQSLLEISRQAQTPLHKHPLAVADMVKVARADLSSLIDKHQAEVELTHDAQLKVDPRIFQQVFNNLITNSIIYKKQNIPPKITIEADNPRGSTRIIFRDNGSGFDNSQADLIFTPFKRLARQDKSGSGMGLAICRQIVTAHGGSIHAKSNDSGAEFTILIPSEN